MDGFIFNSIFVMIGFAVALLLAVYDIFSRSTGYALPIASSALAVALIIYSILNGATLKEILIVTLIFALVNLIAFTAKGKRK